ncbi:hypothetical protein G6F35_012134 [Rhizopus arrhizus]|nr:hypothetical protein G6F35_012134 [Rhizopus arrhizus]
MGWSEDAAPGEEQRDERCADEDRPIRLQHGQVADPRAREAERDQDKGAEAAGRGEDGRDAAGRQCAAAVLGFRHKVLLPGLRLML